MIRINASKAENFLKPIMKHISNGKFIMGEGNNKKKITIKQDFEISKYQVTFDEYDLYCDETKKDKPDDRGWGRERRPAINVSWYDAVEYCRWLSEKSGQRYRLPTEAEWEHACRADTETDTATKWSFGDDEKELEKYAWYDKNSENKTHSVGEKKPNKNKLYDMHGNVWEWCEDDWADSYKKTPRDGSAYEDKSSGRKVLRGGSWIFNADYTRSATRIRYYPASSNNYVGFRLLRTLP